MRVSGFEKVLDHYRLRMREEREKAAQLSPDEFRARVDEFLLPVGEEVGDLLIDLAVGLKAVRIVELGTSYGFSTLYLAEAARRTGGKVATYDLSAEKQDYARKQLGEAGLASFVEWRCGDAVKLLIDEAGPIDLVLLDIWKDLYVPCLDAFYPKLAPGGVIVADNMYHPETFRADAERYRAAVRTRKDVEAVTLPIGNGVDIARRRGVRSP
jgi:predicted O-methyltransferase YrrM